MERAVKEENIASLKGDLAKATSLVLADFRGITVKSDTALRREFRANGCHYQVVKNTLLGIAVKLIETQNWIPKDTLAWGANLPWMHGNSPTGHWISIVMFGLLAASAYFSTDPKRFGHALQNCLPMLLILTESRLSPPIEPS